MLCINTLPYFHHMSYAESGSLSAHRHTYSCMTCSYICISMFASLKYIHGPRHIISFILCHTHNSALHCEDKRCKPSFSLFKLLQHSGYLHGLHSQTGGTLKRYSLSTVLHFTSLLCYCDKDQSLNLKSPLWQKPCRGGITFTLSFFNGMFTVNIHALREWVKR